MPHQLPPQILPSLLRSQHLVFEPHEFQAILRQLTVQLNELLPSDPHRPRHQCRLSHCEAHQPNGFRSSR